MNLSAGYTKYVCLFLYFVQWLIVSDSDLSKKWVGGFDDTILLTYYSMSIMYI